MTRDELDTMWQQALHESVVAGEDFIRYHFAELVAQHERKRMAWTQGHWTEYEHNIASAEREACLKMLNENWYKTQSDVATAIRARGEV
jgi:hypothetical protein